MKKIDRFALIVALLAPISLAAQEGIGPIKDNSFLIEEAYNQERGVVQHIGTFDRARGGSWAFSFTQEWPVPDERHQLSFVVPMMKIDGSDAGIGDVLLNYRHQLVASGPVAFAPRLTVLLPTGDEREGRGAGAAGVQVNLPLSVELGRWLVTHSNAGFTRIPSARSVAGDEAGTTGFNLGQSLIWLARPTLNVLLELVWARDEEVVGDDDVSHATTFVLAPGVRGAINLPSGMQIVPGIAVPIGIGPSDGERSVFFYLSVEHPFRR
ncbi:MAG TPA: hypothetical protein VJ812_00065 [Gemmatimonadaceae bacterium]|jgi:hypothetical protein|nr:hypothetical protein [Gemmatimonadaceae bacterium]